VEGGLWTNFPIFAAIYIVFYSWQYPKPIIRRK
jgi:hypothetical protein